MIESEVILMSRLRFSAPSRSRLRWFLGREDLLDSLDDPRFRRRCLVLMRPFTRKVFSLYKILDLPLSLRQLIRAGDDGQAEAASLGILQLRSNLFDVGIHLDANTCRAKPPRHALIVRQPPDDELHDQHGSRRRGAAEHC